ncbi:MAG: TatD family hydrolase [Kiritimatiellae bacterium]|nr:TatD family hydrolase [Kiritimatiellia bacterium]
MFPEIDQEPRSPGALFDTHAHFECAPEESAAAVERARAAGVTRIMAVGGSEALNRGTEGFRWRAVGWDRDQAGKDLPELDYDGVSAVGEIGLDYHYAPGARAAQMELMGRQLELARGLGLPVVIHTRDADDDTLGLLRDVPSKGIIHCFTGNPRFCRELLDLGFYVSISGIVTFRAADNVRESALVVPDDRILVETDSPFLAPVPMRGNANEPAFLVHTARFLADLRGTPAGDFAELTTRNALAVLGPGRT